MLNYFTTTRRGLARLHVVQRPHRRPGDGQRPAATPRGAWDAGDLAAPAGQDRRRDQRARRRRRRPDGDRELRASSTASRRGARHAGGRAERGCGRRRLGLRPVVDRAARRPPSRTSSRNAIIYQPAAVEPVGDVARARHASDRRRGVRQRPRADRPGFTPVGGGDDVPRRGQPLQVQGLRGSVAGDADPATARAPRTSRASRQADALRDWVPTVPGRRDEAVALVGDFNAYTQEDPLQVLYDAGYTDAAHALAPGQYSYLRRPGRARSTTSCSTGGARRGRPAPTSGTSTPGVGRAGVQPLQLPRHALLRRRRLPVVRPRPGGRRPRRRAPRRAGRPDVPRTSTTSTAGSTPEHRAVRRHGRGAARGRRRQHARVPSRAGDNIGASLFASAVQKDQPTIDVLNALELNASAVGNHEFDKGWPDLTDRCRVAPNATLDLPRRERLPQGHHDPGAAGVRDPRRGRRHGRRDRRRHRGDPVAGAARRHHRASTSATRSRPSTGWPRS